MKIPNKVKEIINSAEGEIKDKLIVAVYRYLDNEEEISICEEAKPLWSMIVKAIEKSKKNAEQGRINILKRYSNAIGVVKQGYTGAIANNKNSNVINSLEEAEEMQAEEKGIYISSKEKERSKEKENINIYNNYNNIYPGKDIREIKGVKGEKEREKKGEIILLQKQNDKQNNLQDFSTSKSSYITSGAVGVSTALTAPPSENKDGFFKAEKAISPIQEPAVDLAPFPTAGKIKKARKKKEFIPPTRQEVEAYVQEKGLNVDIEYFFIYYETTNWKDKYDKKIQNWKLLLQTWHRNSIRFNERNESYKSKSAGSKKQGEVVLPINQRLSDEEVEMYLKYAKDA